MKDHQLPLCLDKEIGRRAESAEWDLEMSRRVITARRRRTGLKTVLPAIALAAGIYLVAPLFTENTTRVSMDEFINTQIDGTYKIVFTGSHGGVEYSGKPLSQDIDHLIDTAMDMR
jgi:hypothetical protein